MVGAQTLEPGLRRPQGRWRSRDIAGPVGKGGIEKVIAAGDINRLAEDFEHEENYEVVR